MPVKKLIERLQAIVGLSDSDRAKLMEVPHTVRHFADGDYILHEGDEATHCAIVANGFVFRQKIVNSRAQILAVYVPGDIPDLHTLHLPKMDHDLCSAGPSTMAFVSHSHVQGLLTNSPALTHAFWRETLVDGAVFREWVANLGARDAISRTAHLFCELAARLEVVGLLHDEAFEFPFAQHTLADACGLSVVHTNRTIQTLRQRGLLEWEKRVVRLPRRAELEALAEFSSGYLHLKDVKR